MTSQNPPSPEALRKNLLARLHIAKKSLGWDDEEYRGALESLGNQRSAKDLDTHTLHQVVLALERLAPRPKPAPKPKPLPRTRDKPSKTQADKMVQVWTELARLDAVDATATALNAYCKRQMGVDRIEWLKSDQAHRFIGCLERFLAVVKQKQ